MGSKCTADRETPTMLRCSMAVALHASQCSHGLRRWLRTQQLGCEAWLRHEQGLTQRRPAPPGSIAVAPGQPGRAALLRLNTRAQATSGRVRDVASGIPLRQAIVRGAIDCYGHDRTATSSR